MKIKVFLLSAIALTHMLTPSLLQAQTSDAKQIETVVIIGTRTSGRAAAESPGPVDIISAADITDQVSGDMSDLISKVIPSYHVRATGDAASLVRSASLRGLPADATLVLVNGKRRHRAAVISFIGAGVSDGAQGADISVIPSSAIERLEVLRDGATAQYGPDAIAGVMNFILKQDDHGGSVSAKFGETYQGDGDFYQLSGNLGLPLTQQGFINISTQYRQVQPFSRSVQNSDAAALIAEGNLAVKDPVESWGAGKVFNDFKSFINLGLDLNNKHQLYAFGNYAKRRVETGFSFRNPNTRSGVFSTALNLADAAPDANGDQIPFLVDSNNNIINRAQIVDANGLIRADLNEQSWIRRYDRLVADVTSDGVSGNCPQTGADNNAGLDVRDSTGLALVQANPDCFVFNEMFPGGFTPSFGSYLSDASLIIGIRGVWDNEMSWDLSVGAGRNKADFYIKNTVNASMGPDSPNHFSPGSYIQQEQNINADLAYTSNGDIEQHIAAGIEWHREAFEVLPGEQDSWQPGKLLKQGFSIGANGFSGFSPAVAGKWSRDNIAFYVDYEMQATTDLLLGLALRWQNYDTFGSTTKYKLSTHWQLSDNIALRATHSTGFRAPTPGQANISNITTLLANGVLIDRGTIAPTNPIAQHFGGEPLTPEQSVNTSVGVVMTFARLALFFDAYQVNFNDRITQSADISLTAEQAGILEDTGFSGASGLRSFRFYVNDFDTSTRGLDVVATYPFALLAGRSELSLTYNYNATQVTHFNPMTLNALRIRQIEDSLPRQRGNVTWRHQQGSWRTLLRLNTFGDYWIAHVGDVNLAFEPSAEITLDAQVAYSFGRRDQYTIVAGVDNLFNNFPDHNPSAALTGSKYPELAPMGIAGGAYYVRLRYAF